MAESRQIEVLYFAAYRDARGRSSELINTTAATPAALYAELGLDAALPLDTQRLRVAINDEFAAWTDPLAAGDRVVFIAPVAGG